MLSVPRGGTKSRKILASAIVERCEQRLHLSGAVAALSPAPITFYPIQHGSQPNTYANESAVNGLSVANVRGAYGLGQIGSSTVTFNGVQGDGTGQTIALVDAYNDPDIASDLTKFDSFFGIAAPPSFTVVGQTGSTTSLPANSATSGQNDWSIEESLDVEWAHAIAPGASILLVEVNSSTDTNLFAGEVVAASYSGVSVVSNSFGGPEAGNESSAYDPSFTTPAGHNGVSFFASTGDVSAAVDYPAQSPNVVAVGGTQLTVGTGNTWSSETAWSSGGGGTSLDESQPSFQAGTITASKRETPDVALVAGYNSQVTNSLVPILDTWDETGQGPWVGGQGTSWSSPMMAALVAIANQGRVAEGLGTLTTVTGSNQVDTRLYQLSTANFHDITTGSNGHSAVGGYDEATGIGTPIASSLIPDLAGAGTVTGRAFVDNGGNGVYGGTDTPIAGQTVYLDLNNDGKLDNSEPSTTTNSQGIYTFTDQPAGGSVRMSSAAPTGYSLTSASSATITYGATDTANFTYQGIPTQVAFSQQPPSSTPMATTISPIIVNIENVNGATVGNNTTTVTLTLSSGTFGTGTNTATAVASGGVATFSGLQINSSGTYTVTASDGSLTTAVSSSFTITRSTPTVTWSAPASITYGTQLSATQLDATTSVPGTFNYTPALGTVLGAGTGQTLSVLFTPTDTTDYTTANGSTTITVLQATPTIGWTQPAAITYGTALSGTQLDATASVPGTFVYTPASGALLAAGAGQNLSVVFTPTDSTDYTTADGSTTISVLQATPVINWAPPASIAYPTPLSSTQLDATANIPGTFVYTPGTGTVLTPGENQSLGVVFTPTDSTDYTSANSSVLITVTGTVTHAINLTGSTFYLKLDNASPQNLDIWTNSTAAGTPADVVEFDTISSISLTANSAGDSFTADFSNGNVQPTGGLTFNGFGSAALNTLTVVGTGGADTVTVPGNGSFNINSQTVSYSSGQIGKVYFAPGGSGEALTVPGTTVTLAPGTSAGITTDILSSIAIGSGAELAVPNASTQASRILVQTGSLTLAGNSSAWTGTLDLSNNDMVVTGGALGTLNSQLAQGYTTGSTGIISSAAIANPTHLSTLGVIQNSADGTPTGTALYGSAAALGLFDGSSPSSAAVLIKYTYFGDADLSGSVDGSDYSRIDANCGTSATGWYNGDFNYDGHVDGTDYTLIDNAFNTQGASKAAELSTSSVLSAKPAAVFANTPVSSPQNQWASSESIADEIFSAPASDLLPKAATSMFL